jgi:hypothetical protein
VSPTGSIGSETALHVITDTFLTLERVNAPTLTVEALVRVRLVSSRLSLTPTLAADGADPFDRGGDLESGLDDFLDAFRDLPMIGRTGIDSAKQIIGKGRVGPFTQSAAIGSELPVVGEFWRRALTNLAPGRRHGRHHSARPLSEGGGTGRAYAGRRRSMAGGHFRWNYVSSR